MRGASALRLPPKRVPREAADRGAIKQPSRYEGILQGVGSGAALGWAADRAAP